jgi:hypothetical protein
MGGDAGRPVGVDAPESGTAIAFRELARTLASRISVMTLLPDPQLRII